MAADKDTEELDAGADAQQELHMFDEYESRPEKVKLTDIQPDSEIIGPAPSKAFVADMRRRGQLEDVILFLAKGKPYKYSIFAGGRRVKSLRILKKQTANAKVILRGGELEMLVGMIASNNMRAPNEMHDVDILRRMEVLHYPLSLSGYSTSKIKQLVELSKAEKPFQDGVRDGLISANTCRQIVKLAKERRAPLLALAKDHQKITAKMVHAAKTAQVGEGGQQLMVRMNIPAAAQAKPVWNMYIVFNPKTNKSFGFSPSLIAVQNKAHSLNDGTAVFRLVEV